MSSRRTFHSTTGTGFRYPSTPRISCARRAVDAAPALLAIAVHQMFFDDFEKSVEMQPGDYENRSLWFKLAVRIARLRASQLGLAGRGS